MRERPVKGHLAGSKRGSSARRSARPLCLFAAAPSSLTSCLPTTTSQPSSACWTYPFPSRQDLAGRASSPARSFLATILRPPLALGWTSARLRPSTSLRPPTGHASPIGWSSAFRPRQGPPGQDIEVSTAFRIQDGRATVWLWLRAAVGRPEASGSPSGAAGLAVARPCRRGRRVAI